MTRARRSATGWLATCLTETRTPMPFAQAIPWRHVDSGDASVRLLENFSTRVLLQVRVWRDCPHGFRPSLPKRVVPGDRVRIEHHGCGHANCADEQWVIRWFTPEGDELVWPFVW